MKQTEVVSILIKRKRKKWINPTLFRVWLFTFILFVSTSIFLHGYNSEIQTRNVILSGKILEIEEQINILNFDIQKLRSSENVFKIANEKGLSFKEENVIILSKKGVVR